MRVSLDDGETFYNPDPVDKEYRRDHSYEYSIEGQGFQLIVKLDDSTLNDNYGQIQVSISQR